MPQIDVVPNMKKAPGKCVCCNTTPMGPDGQPLPAIDLNVDVDWGNNAYLCSECTGIICELWGWVSEETHDETLRELKQLQGDHKRLRERFKEQGEDLKKVTEGKAVEKRLKKKSKRKKASRVG